MAYLTAPARTLCEIQKALVAIIKASKEEGAAAAMCAREWVNIERLKREMRGIPPMKAVSPAELDLMRARRAKVIADAATIEAEEVPKESLFQPPVTTPPTPMPPRGGGDLNNK